MKTVLYILFCIFKYVFSYLNVSFSGLITSVGKRESYSDFGFIRGRRFMSDFVLPILLFDMLNVSLI